MTLSQICNLDKLGEELLELSRYITSNSRTMSSEEIQAIFDFETNYFNKLSNALTALNVQYCPEATEELIDAFFKSMKGIIDKGE